MHDMNAETVAAAVFNNWIARYGTPHTFKSDRGVQFVSKLFQQFAKILGAEHIKTTAYHPQANGKIEHFHLQLKASLSIYGSDWTTKLSVVLLGIRATSFDDSDISRAKMVFGKRLRLPGELIENRPNENGKMESYVEKLKEAF